MKENFRKIKIFGSEGPKTKENNVFGALRRKVEGKPQEKRFWESQGPTPKENKSSIGYSDAIARIEWPQ